MDPNARDDFQPAPVGILIRPCKESVEADPERWVDDHGDYLYSYAMIRLRNPAEAQDAVQDTFLSALKAKAAFAGRSAERGWLLGILKHKIIDVFRRSNRECCLTELGFYDHEEAERFVSEGLRCGAWIHHLGPKDWSPDPGESLDREEFWNVFARCLGKLPKTVCQAFLMREMDDRKTDEICSVLGITQDNAWVMLHRARMALRRCLEKNWFCR